MRVQHYEERSGYEVAHLLTGGAGHHDFDPPSRARRSVRKKPIGFTAKFPPKKKTTRKR